MQKFGDQIILEGCGTKKAGGEASLQNIVPYITSKFDNFLGNDIMRPIIAQEKSSLISGK